MEIGASKPDSDTWPIQVNLGVRSYPIYVAPGILSSVGRLVRESLPHANKCVIVTSPPINELYGEALMKSLIGAGIDAKPVMAPDGEDAKTWDFAGNILGDFLDHGIDRGSFIVALGGGAIGDLAGFVSSIYLRGVNHVQVPTTLLAQVDSSIGGKTAVNHRRGKNLIGTFHQPSLVVSDTNMMKTLPPEELRSGLGEVVKYGVISDLGLFKRLEEKGETILEADPNVLTYFVRKCAAIKAKFVEEDEKDTKDIRAALNYGHTVGHALEILAKFKLRHGEAVAFGMNVAAKLSQRLGFMESMDLERQRGLLEQFGLGVETPPIDVKSLLEAMYKDKKSKEGSIRFVIPTGLGCRPTIRKVSDHLISQTLEEEIGEKA